MGPSKPDGDPLLLRAFRHLLEEGLGLTFPDEGMESLLGGLRRTQSALGLGDLITLFQRLEQSDTGSPEWKRVGMELTTGESFFLRDRGQMDLIRDVLLQEMKSRLERGGSLRLWSAGCSRGEEAYSLAILAEEAALASRVRILGTDINAAALEAAREGWYSPWSLRGVEPERIGRWFYPEGQGYRIHPDLRRRVAFRQHNLLRDPHWGLSEGDGFDLILCRNVFIYFQPRRVREILHRFREALKPGGALILGHAEWGMEAPDGMTAEVHPQAVILRVKPPEAPPKAPSVSKRFPPPAPRPVSPLRKPSHESLLRAIQALADAGRWDAALEQGQAALRECPLSPRLHHLLSQILNERQEPEASLAMLEKALYLDPLLLAAHLDRARLLENQGAAAQAARAWASALVALASWPEDVPLGDLDGGDREGLKAGLEEARRRCERASGA